MANLKIEFTPQDTLASQKEVKEFVDSWPKDFAIHIWEKHQMFPTQDKLEVDGYKVYIYSHICNSNSELEIRVGIEDYGTLTITNTDPQDTPSKREYHMASGAVVSVDENKNYKITFTDGWYATLHPDAIYNKIRMEVHDTDPNPSQARLEDKIDKMKKSREKQGTFAHESYTIHSTSHFTVTSHLKEEALRR